ncbi:MAG: hypothetical protein HRT66_12390 [Flavobacteriaceae bacterium]|nr:hypothetical protein [Flavobacteriaceae bacterium]
MNTDRVTAKHGFVTILPYREKSFFITWLDWRYTTSKTGALSIRAVEISADGTIIN